MGYTLAFSRSACEEDGDGVQRRTGETANPPIRTIPPRIAEHFRAGRHALPEFIGERREWLFIHSKRAKSLPREGNGHPPLLALDGFSGLLSRRNLVQNTCQPGPSLGRLTKRKELVSTRDRGYARQQKVLNVLTLEHHASRGSIHVATPSSGSLHLVEHRGQRAFDPQSLLHFIRRHVRVFSVLQKARPLMIAEELDHGIEVGFPVFRPAFQVHEHGRDAGLEE